MSDSRSINSDFEHKLALTSIIPLRVFMAAAGCKATLHVTNIKREHVMSLNIGKAASLVAGGALLLALSISANAGGLGLGGGVSVGGSGGVSAGAGASVGGAGGVSAGAGASVGGTGGVAAGAGANVGGVSGVSAGLGASIGGTSGLGAGLGIGIGVGTTPSSPRAPTNPPTNVAAVVADMSDTQVLKMKKRCVDILRSSSYDSDLRALCKLISRR